MNLYLVLRSTHISSMLLTILLTMAAEPLYLLAARGPSIMEVQRRYRLAERVRQFSQLTMLGGLLTGLGMVVLAGWNPLAPWLRGGGRGHAGAAGRSARVCRSPRDHRHLLDDPGTDGPKAVIWLVTRRRFLPCKRWCTIPAQR